MSRFEAYTGIDGTDVCIFSFTVKHDKFHSTIFLYTVKQDKFNWTMQVVVWCMEIHFSFTEQSIKIKTTDLEMLIAEDVTWLCEVG
jgi:hypothetical protein